MQQEDLSRASKDQWYATGSSLSVDDIEYSDVIPLVSLSGHEFFKTEGDQLILSKCMLPTSRELITNLGLVPVKGDGRLQDHTEAYATALWMIGYFGYQTLVADPQHHYPPVLNRDLVFNLKVSSASVSMAKSAVTRSLLKPIHKTKKKKGKKFKETVGTVYKPTETLKAQSFGVVDELSVQLVESSPLTDEELLSLESLKNRKFEQRDFRQVDTRPLILDQLKNDEAPQYQYEVTVSTPLSESLIEELDSFKPNGTRTLGDSRNAPVKADILIFVHNLQHHSDPHAVAENMIGDQWLSHDKDQFFEIGYDQMQILYGYNTISKNNHSTVTRRIDILRDRLKWIEFFQSPKGGISYLNDEDKPQCGRYRFTPKFVRMNEGDIKRCSSVKVMKTPFKVLSVTTLDEAAIGTNGSFDNFNSVADDRKWKKHTRKRELEKLTNFDSKKGQFSQTRPLGRVTTHIVSIANEFKQHLRIEGEKTCEVDLVTAHPRLIAKFFEDQNEKDKWLKYLDEKDLYTDLMDIIPIPKSCWENKDKVKMRKCFKNLFNAYLNGGGMNAFDGELELDVNFAECIKDLHPYLDSVVTEIIETKSDKDSCNGVSIEMMELESKIIGTRFMCFSDYLCISTHDGVICKISDAENIKVEVEQRALSILGYPIQVSLKKWE